MSARRWSHGADGRIRWPWRIALFLAAALFCDLAAQLTLEPAVRALFSLAAIQVSTAEWRVLGALVGAHLVMLRFVEHRPWGEVWLDGSAARPALLARGFVIGALAIAVPLLLLMAVGWMDRVRGAPGSWPAAALRVSLFLLPAAFAEELMTRGYIFAVLRERWGWPITIAVTSVVFGLLHLRNPGVTAQAVSLVVLAGVFLAMVLWATRSLYAASAAHFAWNFTLAVIFHAVVSGIPLESPDYRIVDDGPDWATGGPWGSEGGAAGGLGMLGAAAYLYARRNHRRREDS